MGQKKEGGKDEWLESHSSDLGTSFSAFGV